MFKTMRPFFSSSALSDSNRATYSLSQLIIGIIGFLASLYAFVEHVKLKLKPDSSLLCDINSTVSCSQAFSSEYGEFLNIPLGAYGMALFGVIAGFAVLPKFTLVSEKWISHWRLFLASLVLIPVLYLAYLSYFEVGVVCPVCSLIQGLLVINFFYCIVRYKKVDKQEMLAADGAFIKLVTIALALSVPAILAGLILPQIVPSILEKMGQSPVVEDAAVTVNQTPVPAELLSVSKSNFVNKGEDYRKGNDSAPVVIHEFADFECPHCAHASHALEKVLQTVGASRVQIVFRNYPLSGQCNPNFGQGGNRFSCDLANASRCSGQQGKFWEMHNWAFSKIEESESTKLEVYSPQGIKAQAKLLGLDVNRFSECFDSKVEIEKIRDDIRVATQLGIRGTPTIYINGKLFKGVPSDPDSLIQAVEAELASLR